MTSKYDQLMTKLADINGLNMAQAVLGWDQQVNMPPGGATARGQQLSVLARMSHELFTSEETQRLVEDATGELNGAGYDSDQASMLRVVQRDLDDATKVPAEHVAALTKQSILAHETWVKARANSDFSIFQDDLEKLVELGLKTTEYLGYDENPYDALINTYEYGMKASQIKAIFDAHKPDLVQLVAEISEVADRVSDAAVHQPFDIDKQREFALEVSRQIGFDFNRGRQDVAVHPFCTNFSKNDVRVTTRFEDDFLNPALFGMMHEVGHGMYEQGIGDALDGTFLGGGTSLSVHESQSRLWENIVGRSKGFWQYAYPSLQEKFPQLANTDLDTFHKAINKVEPSFIRVEADEATYNLHIILRFELENDIINGRVKVAELPQAWNDRFEAMLGIRPPNDALGVLQDVHWSSGLMGYFSTYALGNLLSVQYYNEAIKAHPSIPEEITQGKFDTLLSWFQQNIHQHGRKFTTNELTERITGESINPAPYVEYLRTKFRGVYGL